MDWDGEVIGVVSVGCEKMPLFAIGFLGGSREQKVRSGIHLDNIGVVWLAAKVEKSLESLPLENLTDPRHSLRSRYLLDGDIVEGDLNARNNLAESRNGGKGENDERTGLHLLKNKAPECALRGFWLMN